MSDSTVDTSQWLKRNQTVLSWPYLPKDVKDFIREQVMRWDQYGQDSFIPLEYMGDIEDDDKFPKILQDFIDEYDIDPVNTAIHFWW